MKERIIKQILSRMKEFDISLEEIANYRDNMEAKQARGNAFDLLCFDKDGLFRTPFSTNNELKPIAIFPFANDGFAIFLNECEKMERCFVVEQDIPTLENWKKIAENIVEINQKLTELGAPIIRGSYFAEPHLKSNRDNIIVHFDNNTMDYKTNHLGAKAKFRASTPYYQ